MMSRVLGPVIVPESSTTRPPLAIVARKCDSTRSSIASHLAGLPCHSGLRRRAPSYNDRTVACPTAHVPPPNSGASGLPSILIGRPSRVFTIRLQDAEQPPHVDA